MRRLALDNYDGETTLGIDVSKYQGDIDWKKVADTPVKFAIIRTGDGRSTDHRFSKNWQEAGDTDLIRGTYHYFRADRGGRYQAELVLAALEDAGGLKITDLPPAIDIEGGTATNLAGGVFVGEEKTLPLKQVAEECLAFLTTLEEELGCLPLVYTGQAFHWWFSQRSSDLAKLFAKYPLWLPDYRKQPHMPVSIRGSAFPWQQWTIWQFSSEGEVGGIQSPVDLNYFRGSEADLRKFVHTVRTEEQDVDPCEVNDRVLLAGLLEEAEILSSQLTAVLKDIKSTV